MAPPLLGPTLQATLCTPDLERSIRAWSGCLHHHVYEQGQLSEARAAQLGAHSMAGAARALMANQVGEPWLELVENPGAPLLDPFSHAGWYSLEICVADVDALRHTIDESSFRVIGEPANLEMSEDIRAMQLVGPAGEVLYLTQIKRQVPPFDLPFARCDVDRLFIPVMLVSDRDEVSSVFESLNGQPGMRFDTKITVINRARNLNINQQHPVCAQQLAGATLIEIDQLDGLQPRSGKSGSLPTGIVSITFAVDSLPPGSDTQLLDSGPFKGRIHTSLQGRAGERIELLA